MAVRDIVEIDEELCDGCGDCVTACAEGAIQIVDGTARLVSDTYCDGLGACLGHCPQGAITVTRRESEAFDEEAVERHLAALPAAPRPSESPMMVAGQAMPVAAGGCPGARVTAFAAAAPVPEPASGKSEPSQLGHWPVQLHLVPPTAPFFAGADVLLAADCVAFAVGGFHRRFLHGRSLAIACPKLDSNQDVYVSKLTSMFDDAEIRSLTVMVMEVPCCSGLVRLVQHAASMAKRTVPITCIVVGVRGDILAEERVA